MKFGIQFGNLYDGCFRINLLGKWQRHDWKLSTGMPTWFLEGCEAQSSLDGSKEVNALATCELMAAKGAGQIEAFCCLFLLFL